MSGRCALHISPHPDDEALGAPATLLGLRDAGWTVLNFLISLGRSEDRPRREREACEAARRAGFDLMLPERPVAISAGDDRSTAVETTASHVAHVLGAKNPQIVVSPATTDAHHGHQMVAEGVRAALLRTSATLTWWTWSVWSDLPAPSLYVPFDEQRLADVLHVLGAYGGELDRNPYDRLVRGRSEANTVLGSERLFGFGARTASSMPYAELLTEYVVTEGVIDTADPRVLDHVNPLRRS